MKEVQHNIQCGSTTIWVRVLHFVTPSIADPIIGYKLLLLGSVVQEVQLVSHEADLELG